MLRPPYTCYSRLYVYHLDTTQAPTVNDPDFIGAWQEGETIVLFFHKDKGQYVDELCQTLACSVVYQADLDYQDWEAGIEISRFSVKGLSIAPVWETSATADIRLDPSVIFGSGFHPTTRLCLESLLCLMENPSTTINSVYDLGCGTGLLGIAAAKKGANSVTAFDYNCLACQVASANAQTNSVALTVRQADLLTESPPTENIALVMANLHHELLVELFKRRSFWLSKYYILSGFFIAREEDLLMELPEGIRFITRKSSSKWALWVLENTGQETSSKSKKLNYPE